MKIYVHKTRFYPALLLWLTCVLLSYAQTDVAGPEGQTLNIHWLPLTMDQAYIRKAVTQARVSGVDAFQLSHTIVHDAEDVLDSSEHRSEVIEAMQVMQDAGLDIWCWTHEIKRLPPDLQPGNFDLRDPRLRKFLQEKYGRFVTDVLPNLDGIILTLAETGIQVYQGVTPAEARRNVSDLVSILYEPLKRHDVHLAVRSFVYKQQELDIVKGATTDMPAEVAVMSKIYPHDWQPYYPVNPIIGAVGQREQWVEFDLGFEYEGQNTVPYADPAGLLEQLAAVWEKGIRTVCLRLDRYHGDEGKSAITTPWGQLNLSVFTAFKHDPQVRAADILSAWEAGQFPGAGRVVGLSTMITRRAMFPKKQWYQNHSVIPDYGYAEGHLKGGNADRLATWTGLAEDQKAEDLCHRPTPAWYQEILAEDRGNRRDLKRIRRLITENNVDLSQYPIWKRALDALKCNVDLYAASKKAYFALRLYQHRPGAIPRDQVAACIEEFERTVKQWDPLPAHMRCHKYRSNATLPQAVKSLRQQLR